MNNISITFRHVEPSDAIKAHVEEKVGKLQRFLRQPMTARVTVSLEKLEHSVEVGISSGGEHHEAHEACDDMYAAIDRVVHKLERQITSEKGAAKARERRGGETVRGAVPLAADPVGE